MSSPDKMPQHFAIEIPDDYSISEPVVHCIPFIDHALCSSRDHAKLDLVKLMKKWKRKYGLQEVVDCLIKFNQNLSDTQPSS